VALKEIIFRDFSGGMNTRDAPSEISENEFPYSLNVTLDERGYLQKRLGYSRRYVSPVGSGKVSNLFFWPTQAKLVAQIGTGLHVDGGASIHTFTTSARIGMCEYLGNLFVIHPVDGCFTYDGITFAAINTPAGKTNPKGDSCAVFQNKVWVNDKSGSAASRLWRTDPGLAEFTNTNFVDIREKDSSQLVLITGASGTDITGRAGLLVFKADSAYRVNDPATGAYATIDSAIGAASNISGISAYGRTYVASTRGIYSTNGIDAMREESRLIENFFTSTQMNQTRPDLYCVGRYRDRLYFSFPKSGETNNSIAIELNPQEKWVVLHSNAASAYASFGVNVTDMVFGDPVNNGLVFNSHRGGTDDGANITSAFQTRWIEPNDGNLVRIRQAKYVGYGTFTANILKDYDDTSSLTQHSVNIIATSGAKYDDGTSRYDVAFYASPQHQTTQVFWSIGVARAISIRLDEVSNKTTEGRNIFANAVVPEVGGWTLSNVGLLAIDLGVI
jgi:hypothetical protein